MHNYDFAIDSSVGIEKSADMILDIIGKKS